MKQSEIVYELDSMIPMYRNFFREFISGLILLGGSFWASVGIIKFGFLVASLFVLMPVLNEFLGKQIRSLQLTPQFLLIKFGMSDKFTKIYLADIKKVRLIERGKDKNTWTNPNDRDWDYDPEDEPVCIIHTNDGKKYHIKSYYFPQGEFAEFLQAFHQSFHGVPTLDKPKKDIPKLNFEQEDRLSRLAYTNMSYLQDDLKLYKALKNTMIEAYSAIYKSRSEADLNLLKRYTILYQYQKEDGTTIFFLENDFHNNLGEENIEIGKNILEASQENIALVESRIEYYKRIANEIEQIRFQEANREKLRKIASRLRELQEQNTHKNIHQPIGEQIDTQSILTLEELTQKVRQTEDLQSSLYLKEHISLFKDDKKDQQPEQ